MALILSAATGNFNAGATWVGGIVPTVGDEARASTGHTITITANVTCDEVSNAGTGIYTLNDGVTLTANVSHKSITASSVCLQFTAASPASGFIVGNLTGSATGQASSTATAAASVTSSGTLTITGNCTGGSGAFGVAARNISTGTLTITGNVTGGGGNNAFGANNISTGTLNATGNVTGGTVIAVNNAAGGTVNVTGNITGGTAANIYGVNNVGVGTVNVTGNVTGGTVVATSHGINNTSTGIVAVTGVCTGGAAGAAGANNAAAGTITTTRAKGNGFGIGSVATAAGVGIASVQSSITKIEELEFGALGMSPVSGPCYITPLSTNVAIFTLYPGGTGTKTLIDATANAAMPAITDVRFGTSYASGALTGVAYIPSASSVAFGVPVDNTTGTATLTAADVRAAIGLTSANLDTQLAAIPTAAGNASAVRTELAPELTKITEVHAIHGLDIANALTVTPTSRTSGAITQSITGDGTTNTVVTRV